MSLPQVIARSCYKHDAKGFVDIFRRMIRSFHINDRTVDRAIALLSQALVERVPTATMLSNTTDAIYDTYSVQLDPQTRPFIFVWKGIMAQGSYNDVYKAIIRVRCDRPSCDRDHEQKAVVKITSQAPRDLRVYLMENIIHAILNQLPDAAPFVVHMFCPFKLHQNTFPSFKFGCVLEDPGYGDLASFILDEATDDTMFSLFTQIGLMLLRMQQTLRFQHRDLKADNLVIVDNKLVEIDVIEPVQFTFPSHKIGCKMIDFGMSRLEIDNEYVGCDVYYHSTDFNPCQDLQFLVTTTLEDFAGALGQRCPRFWSWLQNYGAAIFGRVREFVKVNRVRESMLNYHLGKVTERERLEQYTPQGLLRALAPEWRRHEHTELRRSARLTKAT